MVLVNDGCDTPGYASISTPRESHLFSGRIITIVQIVVIMEVSGLSSRVAMITVSADMIQYPGNDPVVTAGSCRSIVPNASWSTSVVPDESNGGIESLIRELVRCIWRLAVGVLGS